MGNRDEVTSLATARNPELVPTTESGYNPCIQLVDGSVLCPIDRESRTSTGRSGPHNVSVEPEEAPRSSYYPDTPLSREATRRVWERLED